MSAMQAAANRLALELCEHDIHNEDWIFLAAALADASIELAAIVAHQVLEGGEISDRPIPGRRSIMEIGAQFTALSRVAYHHSAHALDRVLPPKFDGTAAEFDGDLIELEDQTAVTTWLAGRSQFMLFAELDKEEANA